MHKKKRKKWRKILVFMLLILVYVHSFHLQMVVSVKADSTSRNKDKKVQHQLETYMKGIVDWKKKQVGLAGSPLLNHVFLENAGDTNVDWYVIGLGRTGIKDDYAAYLAVIEDVVQTRYQRKEKLSNAKATEWHRISLAILSSGGDPTKIGKEGDARAIDLIADGTFNRGKTTRSLGAQGINGWIWGLITLDSMRYVVPEDAHETRKSIITEILRGQLRDGGFALHLEEQSDIDITAMAIQALAPYYNSEESFSYTQRINNRKVTKTVREVVDEALQFLSKKQLADGDFTLMGMPNVESTSQVIVALTALGIDPLKDKRFIKNGNTLLDGVLKYRMPDGGFIHSETFDEENPTALPSESNPMASEQVLYTFAAMYRYYEGYRTLYDFREEMPPQLKKKIVSLEGEIAGIPSEAEKMDKAVLKKLFATYLEIPVEERSYVYNYVRLADAMEKIGIKNTSELFTEHVGVNRDGNGTITPLFGKQTYKRANELFTKADQEKVQALLKEKPSTAHFVEVVKLINQLENAKNKAEYEYLMIDLQNLRNEMEALEQEIEAMNETILNELHPFHDISVRDRKVVDDLIDRYQRLSAYDQTKIQGYEDIEKAKAQIDSLIRERYITIIIVIAIIAMGFVWMKRYLKRRREKMKQKMLFHEET